MQCQVRRSNGGFTLVELLVVIAIIGILVSLLLPAVQSAREAARRMQCQNNIKQLGLALHNYHGAMDCFPPGVNSLAGEDPGTTTNFQRNWVISILPYIEQQALYDSFNFSKAISATENSLPRAVKLNAMLCPSDQPSAAAYIGNATEGANWARGNYAGNPGNMHLLTLSGRTDWAINSTSPGWEDSLRRGVMGPNAATSIAQIRDGTSNTIMIAELRIGVSEQDRRGTWAMGCAGASSIYAHGAGGDANGPNPCNDLSDDIKDGGYLKNTSPGNATMIAKCMTLTAAGTNNQAAPRSSHSDGIFVGRADGGVQFISDFVQLGGSVGASMAVWDRLIASGDGLVLDSSKY